MSVCVSVCMCVCVCTCICGSPVKQSNTSILIASLSSKCMLYI